MCGRYTLGGKKQPYYLKLKTKEPIAFAGLFDVWRSHDEKERVVSCTILTSTGAARGTLPPLHRYRRAQQSQAAHRP